MKKVDSLHVGRYKNISFIFTYQGMLSEVSMYHIILFYSEGENRFIMISLLLKESKILKDPVFPQTIITHLH